jgi:hypothetical protein
MMPDGTVIPPLVYVPCQSIKDDELTIDVRTTRDGQTALLVYSALDRLVDCCGPDQPWAVIPTANLDKVGEYVPFDMILFDVEVPEEHRRKAA